MPLVAGAFWWGSPGVTALAVVVGVVAAMEFGGLMGLSRPDRAVLAAAVSGVVLTFWLAPGHGVRAVAVGALAIAAVPLLAGDSTHGLRRLGAGLLGLVWLSVLAALAPLGATALALFVAVSVGDIVAYFAGQRLGGPRLSPLSPAKRWSGTLSGAAAALGVLAALSVLSLPMAVAVAVGAPAGTSSNPWSSEEHRRRTPLTGWPAPGACSTESTHSSSPWPSFSSCADSGVQELRLEYGLPAAHTPHSPGLCRRNSRTR